MARKKLENMSQSEILEHEKTLTPDKALEANLEYLRRLRDDTEDEARKISLTKDIMAWETKLAEKSSDKLGERLDNEAYEAMVTEMLHTMSQAQRARVLSDFVPPEPQPL